MQQIQLIILPAFMRTVSILSYVIVYRANCWTRAIATHVLTFRAVYVCVCVCVCLCLCLCVGYDREPCKTSEPTENGNRFLWAQGTMCEIGIHIDATWRMQRVDLCGDMKLAVAACRCHCYCNFLRYTLS